MTDVQRVERVELGRCLPCNGTGEKNLWEGTTARCRYCQGSGVASVLRPMEEKRERD